MATHSSNLAWRISWTEELGGLQSMGRKELDTTERLHFYFNSPLCIYTTSSLFIHLLMGTWLNSFLGCYKLCFCEHWGACIFKLLFLLFPDIYPGVELLDHIVILLIFWGTTVLLSIVTASIYIPANNARAFPFLHTFSRIYCLLIFWWWPFWPMWGDISLWFWF